MIDTWPAGHDEKYYYRDFRLNCGDQPIGRATTAWSLLDLTSRKRSNHQLEFEIQAPVSQRVFSENPRALKIGLASSPCATVKVRYGDLDVNRHVNNVKFIEWLLEGFTLDFYQGMQVSDLQVDYLAEATHQDQIMIKRNQITAGSFQHELVNGERVICRATSSWTKVE